MFPLTSSTYTSQPCINFGTCVRNSDCFLSEAVSVNSVTLRFLVISSRSCGPVHSPPVSGSIKCQLLSLGTKSVPLKVSDRLP